MLLNSRSSQYDPLRRAPGPLSVRCRSEKGFTLIELLATISILGILSAIATQQYSEYRTRAFDARSESNCRDAIVAEEAYYTDHDQYVACDASTCGTVLPGMVLSDGVELTGTINSDGTEFDLDSVHPRGEYRFQYHSVGGTFVHVPK
jgi:prepilin-type N-terminal cleavage/methylation domain-containing protein